MSLLLFFRVNMLGSKTSREVIALYRNLLKYRNGLQYTDKDYFYRRVRFEFEKNKYLVSKEEINFQVLKGKTFLQKGLLV